jgi:ABC-type amino acid transport substrate-binding protein
MIDTSKTSVSISILTLISVASLGFSLYNFSKPSQAVAQNAQTENSKSRDILAEIKAKGELDVCYSLLPPLFIKDSSTGKISGHEADLVENLAKEMKVKVNYKEGAFGDLVAAIQTGKCVIGPGFFTQIPRAEAVSFSKPLYFAGLSALGKSGETRFKTIQDMDQEGITIATATGEGGDNYLKQNFKKAKIVSINVDSADISRFMTEVSSGRADLAVADASQIANYAKTHPETSDLFASNPFQMMPVAWALPQGDPGFVQFINTSLDYMETTGQVDAALRKYDAKWIRENKNFKTN